MSLAAVFEGSTDLPVVKKLATDAGFELVTPINARGKDNIDRDLQSYNNAAQGSPWLVLRDLDNDKPCAPEYIASLRIQWAPWMCFRLAVREVESWFLADVEGFARFFGVKASDLPHDPDGLTKAKRELLAVIRRSNRKRIREAMLPKPGDHVLVGPEYEGYLIEYGETVWDLDRASRKSASLFRARRALRACARRWGAFTG